ncbi:MAG: hypothetical protein LBB08_01965, partial [Rickettsiales bacterium]|nr:hypothetical protein [Rickettsiales bacterium]
QKEAAKQLTSARLGNYDSHNSDDITQCLANVREDMFGSAGCGPANVNCLDISGRFVTKNTGEPIYSQEFYLLEKQISLSANAVHDSLNLPYVNMLNGKKQAAAASLDKCRDVADQVWDEYLRQTLADLSQKQRQKTTDVREECVGAVNQCYDEKLEQMKSFASDLAEDASNAEATLLTEEMCHVKLDTCAILYGGGPPGLEKLRDYVRDTNVQKLRANCEGYLAKFIDDLCTPTDTSSNGSPYKCRLISPGNEIGTDGRMGEDGINVPNAKTLYSQVYTKAQETCVRPDETQYYDTDVLPPEVAGLVVKTVDETKKKIDAMLEQECSAKGGIWKGSLYKTVALDEANISDWREPHKNWGVCTPPLAK